MTFTNPAHLCEQGFLFCQYFLRIEFYTIGG
jgi:hypothetical protein